MTLLQDLRKRIDEASAVRNDLKKRIELHEKKLKTFKRSEMDAQQAQFILQRVAKETQEQLEYRVSELVSLSLAAVFPNPYTMQLKYEIKRNKTEAQLLFARGKQIIDPMESAGHGPVDVSEFALRCSLWSLQSGSIDNVLVLDEPFRHINDETRRLHRNAVLMVKEISTKLGLQFIIVSQIPEFRDIADTIFKVSNENDVATVKQVQGSSQALETD